MSHAPSNRAASEPPGDLLSLDALRQICSTFGSDLDYLDDHYWRFVDTLKRFGAKRATGLRVLDVGAHWLHQSLLWKHSGAAVAALDLPSTFSNPAVVKLAQSEGIQLLPEKDLEQPTALAELSADSIDVVLFTEIIEHLSFNPIGMWQAIYRVLKPGGVIVLTTPNFYRFDSRTLNWWKLLRGLGGGPGVSEILQTHTFGHHWKEFSAAELKQYFATMSADFLPQVQHVQRFPLAHSTWLKRLAMGIEQICPGLRPNLYAEIRLREKRHGIAITPSW